MKRRCNLAIARSCPIICVLSNLPSQKPSKQIAFVTGSKSYTVEKKLVSKHFLIIARLSLLSLQQPNTPKILAQEGSETVANAR